MKYFVPPQSIVRKIWGNGDTILFIFAGAAAEFSLNKAVDWLYYTGKLPSDPIGRLFSTVIYAREIVFSPEEKALASIDKITGIHAALEKGRGYQIPDWAYRDVLFMLIHYSIAAYELLERKMTDEEKADLFDVFQRIGARMQLSGLPTTYDEWTRMHEQQLQDDLLKSDFTIDLYKQYRKHLGPVRFIILKESQKMVVPKRVNDLLELGKPNWVYGLLGVYKASRVIKINWFLKSLLLPAKYKQQIKDLDQEPV